MRRSLPITILGLLYILMFWSDLVAFRPGMDAMTYGAVARNMAIHGDWAVPHYTTQAYPNFFQHPPLALWMMAGTMRGFSAILGPEVLYADWILKALPALMAALCAIGVYLWGRKIRGENFAFLATFILLTSTRFAKYSKGFMLDPFLATFSFWAVYLACQVRKPFLAKPWTALISGLLVTAAFLSKGLFAFAPLAVVLLVIGRKNLPLFFVGLVLPLALWFVFGDASNYLAHYYSEHVAGRVGSYPLLDHLAPMINLGKVYWPWLPFFLIGAVAQAKRRDLSDESAILLSALAFIGGFSLVGSFLEQYHTATYPFAALVSAMGVPLAWERFRVPAQRFLHIVALGFVVYLATNPYSMQGTEHKNPIRIALKEARLRCGDPAIRRITISTGIAEIWYALAIGSWNTGWDPRSGPPNESPSEANSELLLAAATDTVGAEWIPTGIGAEGLRIYRVGLVKCSK